MAVRPASPLRSLFLAGTCALLAACGGGETADTSNSVGTLTDSRVQGVEYYSINSGLSGTTDANGRFAYKPGDTIVFALGGLPLGMVKGTGSQMTVTPIQLVQGASYYDTASKRENAVTNLLVLLQSLDSDEDPSNGISIAPEAITALEDETMANVLYSALPLASDTFSANSYFNNLLADLGLTAVPPASALEHFQTEFLANLAGQYYGISNDTLFALRFRADGSYLMTQVRDTDGSTEPGLERGTIAWTPATGRISATTNLDTNGDLGFSYLATSENTLELAIDGSSLVMTSRDGSDAVLKTYRVARLGNGSTLGGLWVKGSPYSLNALHLFFLPGGDYLALDPTGDTGLLGTDAGCAHSGIEAGGYGTQAGLIVFANGSYDSTGCAGTHDTGSGQNWTPAYTLDGSLLLSSAGGPVTFYRADNTTLD